MGRDERIGVDWNEGESDEARDAQQAEITVQRPKSVWKIQSGFFFSMHFEFFSCFHWKKKNLQIKQIYLRIQRWFCSGISNYDPDTDDETHVGSTPIMALSQNLQIWSRFLQKKKDIPGSLGFWHSMFSSCQDDVGKGASVINKCGKCHWSSWNIARFQLSVYRFAENLPCGWGPCEWETYSSSRSKVFRIGFSRKCQTFTVWRVFMATTCIAGVSDSGDPGDPDGPKKLFMSSCF